MIAAEKLYGRIKRDGGEERVGNCGQLREETKILAKDTRVKMEGPQPSANKGKVGMRNKRKRRPQKQRHKGVETEPETRIQQGRIGKGPSRFFLFSLRKRGLKAKEEHRENRRQMEKRGGEGRGAGGGGRFARKRETETDGISSDRETRKQSHLMKGTNAKEIRTKTNYEQKFAEAIVTAVCFSID